MKIIKRSLLAVALAASTALASPALAQDKLSLVVNVVQIFGTVDPAKITDYTEYMAAVNLYDALTTVDSDGAVVPQLAESWEVSDDNKTYTFKLKQGATFQDGSPVEAKDVVYSMKRLLTLNEGPAYLFSDLVKPENVRAVDDMTVEIKLERVYAPFISNTPLILVVNSDLLGEQNDGEWAENYLGENSAGAGPYSLTGWTRGAEMILRRYEGYHAGWPNERPVDELRFVVTRDEATVRALAQRGELGMSSQYQSNETYAAIEALDNYKVIKAQTATGFYLKLNNKLAPTDDVHIRRAIAYAMDYATIRDVIYPGGEMKSALAPLFADAFLDTLPEPEFNLEKAAEEVAKSKYAGQEPIKISHSYVANTAFEEEIGLLFKATLESIGFSVDLQPEPWNRITELATKPETTPNTTQVFYGPTYPSPDSVFFVQYHSKAAGTWSSMSWAADPQIDGLIDKSRETVDADARNDVYKEIQAKLHDKQAEVPLLTQLKRMAAHKCLQGYKEVPMQSWDYDFSRMYWKCEG
ncbi:ABC transporter substrate-binding protein [Aquamicrobium sp. LC103]|uniref:ABC transporter substrate-binding protein n=1 Tax=Aquamicrobium sp. LC103 TaxID=1120658 RepID=UPI00063E71BD|nr:ABC transporter substrate-binding protein [Aquamicrobium sp. LC103]TKT69702.1 ABC transporter substrate-binding protein [Aquamicrobium sp. LC103]